MKSSFRDRILTVGHRSSDALTVAQFKALRKMLPQLYFGLFAINGASNVLMLSYAPVWVAMASTVLLSLFFICHFLNWRRLDRSEPDPETMRQRMWVALFHFAIMSLVMPALMMQPPIWLAGEAEILAGQLCAILAMALLSICFLNIPAFVIVSYIVSIPSLVIAAVLYTSAFNLTLILIIIVIASLSIESILKQFEITVRGLEAESRASNLLKVAQDTNLAKGEIMISLGQRIRQPLLELVNMSHERPENPETHSLPSRLGELSMSGTKALNTVDDMINFAALEKQQATTAVSPFRLSDLLNEVIQTQAGTAHVKKMEILQRVDQMVPSHVYGNQDSIRRVLSCLVNNAIQHSNNGHVLIDLSGKVKKGIASITFRIEDTGKGIEPHRLPLIFEQYAHPAENGQSTGSGFGLAIAMRLVHMMDGEIGVESMPDKGSVFWFTLPLRVHEVLETTFHAPECVAGSRILIIDSNPLSSSMLKEELYGDGFEVACADKGDIALAFVAKSFLLNARLDGIIINGDLDDTGGDEVIMELLNSPISNRLPIIHVAFGSYSPYQDKHYPHIRRREKPARYEDIRSALVQSILSVTEDEYSHRGTARNATTPQSPALIMDRQSNKKVDILVVEQNNAQQIVYRNTFDALEISYRIVSSGERALELAGECHPALTLIDITLKDVNWKDVASAVRVQGPLPDGRMPMVFAVSGKCDDPSKNNPSNLQITGYLERPISPAKLSNLVNVWLRPLNSERIKRAG